MGVRNIEYICIGIIEIFNGINDPFKGTAAQNLLVKGKAYLCRAPTINFNHFGKTTPLGRERGVG